MQSATRRSGTVSAHVRVHVLDAELEHRTGRCQARGDDLGGGALLRMRQLKRIAALAMVRHEPFVLLCSSTCPSQFVFLYDFHVLNLLEAWQAAIRPVRPPLVPGVGEIRGPLLAGDAGPRPSPLDDAGGRRVGRPPAGPPARAPAVAGRDLRGQRRGDRARRLLPPGHRLEHVGQEHAVARDRRQCGPRAGRARRCVPSTW